MPRSGVRPLAVAIMSNHLHILVQQGERPLKTLMQPLLRRLALEVQRAHGLEGPVFWRPYGCEPCLDPSHARNALVYTHLNPVRAGMCKHPDDYAWTTHALYSSDPYSAVTPQLRRLAGVVDPEVALPLFARETAPDPSALRGCYREFVAWRMRQDGADPEDPAESPSGVGPLPPSGWRTTAWGPALSPLFHVPLGRERSIADGSGSASRDLATLARITLAAEAPDLTIGLLRGRRGGAEHVRLRHRLIRRLHEAGFRNIEIARFLNLSESAIWYALR